MLPQVSTVVSKSFDFCGGLAKSIPTAADSVRASPP
jgi:hypothetical protein